MPPRFKRRASGVQAAFTHRDLGKSFTASQWCARISSSALRVGLPPGDADDYIVTDGALKGQRGFITRAEDGTVTGVDMAGRLFSRTQ